MDAYGRVVANFALQHLKAAITFRDRVIVIERERCGQEFGAFFEEIRSYGSACVTSAASSLEALINELFLNQSGRLCGKKPSFKVTFWGNKGIERMSTLKKYQHALSLVEATPLDESSEVFLDATALIGIRNYLVHFRPSWDEPREREAKLIRFMQSRYQLSPFPDAGSDFFTMRSMSAGCATWAVGTAFRFMRAFAKSANIDDKKMEGFWKLET